MSAKVALLPGDGVGAEVIEVARAVMEATGAPLEFDVVPCGGQYYLETGLEWPSDAVRRCTEADALLLGAVGWPRPGGGGPVVRPDGELAGYEAVIGNRLRFDLFANVRPVRVLEGLRPRVCGRATDAWGPADVDMVIIRENTEGLYIGAGAVHRPGGRGQTAVDTRLVTRAGAERVIRLGFEMARERTGAPKDGVRRLTAVAKANLLEGCRLFVEIFEELAADYPDVAPEVMIVDAFAGSLVADPGRYDVVVTTNLFGDILTDLAAVLQGGMGMAVGMNLGVGRAMFEPVHGSAPDLAGKDAANPLAAVMAGAELLRWLGRDRPGFTAAGDRIDAAVRDLVRTGHPLPADLVGAPGATCSAVAEALLQRVTGA